MHDWNYNLKWALEKKVVSKCHFSASWLSWRGLDWIDENKQTMVLVDWNVDHGAFQRSIFGVVPIRLPYRPWLSHNRWTGYGHLKDPQCFRGKVTHGCLEWRTPACGTTGRVASMLFLLHLNNMSAPTEVVFGFNSHKMLKRGKVFGQCCTHTCDPHCVSTTGSETPRKWIQVLDYDLTDLIWGLPACLLQGNDGSLEGVSPGCDGPQQLSLFRAQSWKKLCWRVPGQGCRGHYGGVWAQRL